MIYSCREDKEIMLMRMKMMLCSRRSRLEECHVHHAKKTLLIFKAKKLITCHGVSSPSEILQKESQKYNSIIVH